MSRRFLAAAMSAVMATGLAVMVAPGAQAGDVTSGPNLTGRWESVLVRDDEGWSMSVRRVAGKSDVYVARFSGQFGEVPEGGPKVRLVVNGSQVRLIWRGVRDEAPAPGQRTVLRGTIGQDGSIFFPRCYKVLTNVDKQMADEACMFQQLP
jgi:hypothetical protein